MPDIQNGEPVGNAHRFAPAAPDEEYVYGACCPGWHTAADQTDALADWIGFMRARKVDRVCSLLPGDHGDGAGGDERDCADGAFDTFRDVFGPEQVCTAPILDHRLVDPGLLDREILPFLDDAAAAEERVVVLCLTGLGRTGQVLAVWLAHDRGYAPDRAIETVEEMGRKPRDPVRAGNATDEELRDLLAIFG